MLDWSADIRLDAIEAYNDFLDIVGKNCTLVYEPIQSECPNCYWDSLNGRSSGEYKEGGPQPFSNQICPYCIGAGLISSPQTETIKMLVLFQPKFFWQPLPPTEVRKDTSFAQTKFNLVDLPKVQQAKSILLQNEILGHLRNEYQLYQAPADPYSIIQGMWAIATWEQRK